MAGKNDENRIAFDQ